MTARESVGRGTRAPRELFRPALRIGHALAGAAVLSAVLAGCDSTPPSDGDTSGGDSSAQAVTVAPAEFAETVQAPDTFVLNVHTPDEGSIAGTDEEIP